MNNFKIIVIECVLKAVHKNCDDILKEQINSILAPINGQLLSHLYWFSRLWSKQFRSAFGEWRSVTALYCLQFHVVTCVSPIGPFCPALLFSFLWLKDATNIYNFFLFLAE